MPNVRGHQFNWFKATPWTNQFNGQPRWDGTNLYVYDGVSEILIGPQGSTDAMYYITGTYTGDGTGGRVIAPGVPVGGVIQYVALIPRTAGSGSGFDWNWKVPAFVDAIAAGGIFQIASSTSFGSTGLSPLTATTFTISDTPPQGTNAVGQLETYIVLYKIP